MNPTRKESKNRLSSRWLTPVLVGMLIPALTGCIDLNDYTLTGRLWSADMDPDRHFAMTNAVPSLFQAPDGSDVVVRYSEGRSGGSNVKRRAYLLYKNQPLIDAGKPPEFLNPKKTERLAEIPVLSATLATKATNANDLHGIMVGDGSRFALFSGTRELGTFALPVYLTPNRRAERALLTPVTVVGDVVIYTVVCGVVIGVVGGLVYLGLRYGN